MLRILLTRSSPTHRVDLVEALVEAGHEVATIEDPTVLPATVTTSKPNLLFLDIDWVVSESLDLIHFLRSAHPTLEVITLTSVERVRQAASTILRGASLYLVEPITPLEVLQVVANASAHQANAVVVRQLEQRTLETFFGSSPAMTKLFRTVLKVAPTDATVLITGESGTGKEVLAQVIHRLSGRAGGRFVAVNCAAIPDALLESELFGHVRGAFTGAVADKRGLLEEADQGTCFLDEVGELAPAVQAKLLRFLQDRTVRRVGGLTSRQVDVRILAATNRNLVREVTAGRFREDLYFRLNLIGLHLLPLRERRETLPFLIEHILSRLRHRYGKSITGLTAEATRLLWAYSYPGNIRELENILEYATIMTDGLEIDAASLPAHLTDATAPRLPAAQEDTSRPMLPASEGTEVTGPVGDTTGLATLADKERDYIQQVLAACGGSQTKAAKVLGISRTSLWRRLAVKV